MNEELELVLIGQSDDIDQDTVENFEHEDVDYAIYHLNSGFYATQGYCLCGEHSYLSEASLSGEELECANCNRTFSIVSGDSISDPESKSLKVYDISEIDGNLYLNL
mgnify:CR=1 FL=1|tara:strand:- start:509 stop:829 length:321 start_codon:yes stop_codon:yes gene_type:complete